MHRRLLVSVFTAPLLLLSSQYTGADARAAELHIGRASTVITPSEQTGGIKLVLDDLHAKALVLQQGDTAAAIVALDLPVVNRDVVLTIRGLVDEHTTIPAANVMVSATHTHTGLIPGWAGSSSFPALFPPKDGPQVRVQGDVSEGECMVKGAFAFGKLLFHRSRMKTVVQRPGWRLPKAAGLLPGPLRLPRFPESPVS